MGEQPPNRRAARWPLVPVGLALAVAAATPPTARAAPQVLSPQVYTERVGPNPVLAEGWHFLVGATNVVSSVGVDSVRAEHLPLGSGPDYAVPANPSVLFPNAYIAATPYAGQTGQWLITATDSTGTGTAVTHNLSDIRDLPLLTGLAATGPLLTPTFSWDRVDPVLYPSFCQAPACVPGFDFFNYGVVVRDASGPLLVQSSFIPNALGTPTSWTLPAGVLQPDRDYLIGFRLNHSELEVINPDGSFFSPLENRSSAYLTYTTVVPEPASAALLAVGLLSLLLWRRSRGHALEECLR